MRTSMCVRWQVVRAWRCLLNLDRSNKHQIGIYASDNLYWTILIFVREAKRR